MFDDLCYLDYNASTPCDPRVLEAVAASLGRHHANPTSRHHRPGREAFAALEDARARAARSLGARSPSEITFTSGATEANNLAIFGVAKAAAERSRHLITQATEHASVLEPLLALQRQGWRLTVLGVDAEGRIDLGELERALSDDTVLVSLMFANNETGTVQPLAEAVELVHRRAALLHCDAAQAVGKLPVDVTRLGVDLATVSGHKTYGPKGVGALYRRRHTPPLRLHPLMVGGGQENGLRSGTPNVPAAIGFAVALEIAAAAWRADMARLGALRDRLESQIDEAGTGCSRNGALQYRLANTSNLSFSGVEANALIASLPDVAMSTGSACTSAHPEPSYVLRAMGLPESLAAASIRISLGRFTTDEEVERAGDRIVEEVTRLRGVRRQRRK